MGFAFKLGRALSNGNLAIEPTSYCIARIRRLQEGRSAVRLLIRSSVLGSNLTHRPNNVFGWGLLNILNAVQAP